VTEPNVPYSRGPVVESKPRHSSRTADGRLKIAPTTLKVYEECPRKWAFEKLARLTYERGTGQVDGKDAHSHVEAYLVDGVTPDESTFAGRLASVLIPHVPRDSVTEEYVIVDTGSPLWVFHGYVDGSVPYVEVWDAKFYAPTSVKWMVTAESLRSDPQAVIYSVAKSAPRFVMHYVIKPKDRPVAHEWAPGELDAQLDRLDDLALQMLWHLVHTRDANEVPHRSATACDSFGKGCPYAAHCRLHYYGAPTPWTLGR